MATVLIPAPMRPLCGGQDRVEAQGRTLRQVIDDLDARYPGMKAQLVAEDAIRPGLAVAIDDVLTEVGLLQPVQEGSVINILPAMGGGSPRPD